MMISKIIFDLTIIFSSDKNLLEYSIVDCPTKSQVACFGFSIPLSFGLMGIACKTQLSVSTQSTVLREGVSQLSLPSSHPASFTTQPEPSTKLGEVAVARGGN